jgi:hypothetical protein
MRSELKSIAISAPDEERVQNEIRRADSSAELAAKAVRK